MSSLCWAKNGVFIWESGPLHLSNLGFHGSGWRPEKFPTKKLFVGSFLGLAWRIHWAILGHVGAMLGLCVTHVGLMLVHVVEVTSFVSSRLDVFSQNRMSVHGRSTLR